MRYKAGPVEVNHRFIRGVCVYQEIYYSAVLAVLYFLLAVVPAVQVHRTHCMARAAAAVLILNLILSRPYTVGPSHGAIYQLKVNR